MFSKYFTMFFFKNTNKKQRAQNSICNISSSFGINSSNSGYELARAELRFCILFTIKKIVINIVTKGDFHPEIIINEIFILLR